MKNMKHFLIAVIIVITACKFSKKEGNVAGVYVGHFEHEYGINDDTLEITNPNKETNIYQLSRKTGMVRKRNNKMLPKQWHRVELTFEFNPQTQVLTDMKYGKIMIVNFENSTIQFGSTIYTRLVK